MLGPVSLAADRARLCDDPSSRGRAWARRWSDHVDAWLVEQWAGAIGDADGSGVALLAVGGYGRGELAPGSDLDLLLLHRSRTAPAELAERLWYPIWDQGLKLGHAVRTPGDALGLAADDLDTATALLSIRLVAGDETLAEELAVDARAQWRKRSKRYLGQLRTSVAARQARFGEVAFLLEPDLKEGRGGLRDIQALRWAAVAREVLEVGDAEPLDAAEEVLVDARVELHRVRIAAGDRPSDRLSLQDQDAVAQAVGTDADALMAGLADAARNVAWIADESWDRVGASLATSVSLLGWRSRERAPGLVVRNGQVLLEAATDPAAQPELPLEAAVLAARKDARIARSTLLRFVDRSPEPDVPWSSHRRDLFVELLAQGHAAVPVVEALDHVGLWERYLPEWAAVRNRPQRNAYHRFTVDRHLLETSANAAALVERVDRPDLLLLGALLHDIGKGHPGDHTEVGMDLVVDIGDRMGLDAVDTAVLVDLVRLHLLLPDVATRRDLSDEGTIRGVAQTVGDARRLHLLAALTEADSLATGPAAWGNWKAGLVRKLVQRVDHLLAGGDLAALSVADFPDARQLALLDAGELVVDGRGFTLELVSPDRPGLFGRVAGVLALHGLEVHAADVASRGGMALEQFEVSSPFSPQVPWDAVIAHVYAALEDRLAIEARLADRIRTYARRPSGLGLPPPAVRFDDTSSDTATVIEVHAADRIGLLYRVLAALSAFSLDVRTAKVQTLGEMVIDSFYVTHASGSLVTDPEVRAELERALLHAIS